MSIIRTIAVTLTILLTQASYAAVAPEDPVRGCIEEICGPTRNLVNARGAGDFSRYKIKEITDLYFKEVAPRVNWMINIELRMTELFLKLWDNFGTEFNLDELNSGQQRMLVLAYVFASDLSALEKVGKYGPHAKYAVDRKKWQELEPDRSKEEIELISTLMETILEDSNYKTGQSLEDSSFEFYKKWFSIHTPEDLKANAKQNIELLEKWKAEYGAIFIPQIYFDPFEAAIGTGELDISQQRRYVSTVSSLYMLKSYYESAKMLEVLDGFKVTQEDIRLKFAPKIMAFRAALKTPAVVESRKAKIFETCKKNVNGIMSSIPSEFAVRQAAARVVPLKTAAYAAAKKYFSGKDLENANEAIRKANFSFPLSGNSGKDLLIKYFHLGFSYLDGLYTLVSGQASAADRKSFFISQLLDHFGSKINAEEGLFDKSFDQCEDLAPPTLTDAALSLQGDILTSWQSVLWPQYGASIMAHELGHVVSSAVGHNAFRTSIACKAERHSRLYAKPAETNHDEEDWADTFSTSVAKELEKIWPYVANKGCLLIPIDTEKEDLMMSAINLKEDAEESHSSGIFRLINIQMDLGRPLPASCHKLYEVNRISNRGMCGR